MNKTVKNLMLGGLLIATPVLAPVAFAHEGPQAPEGFVGDSTKHVVTDGSGDCLRTGTGTGTETCVEAAPVAEAPAAAEPVVETITLGATALFDFDKSTLRPEGAQALDEVVSKIKGHAQVDSIVVTGHTDAVGSDSYNQGLSERRAATVSNYLVNAGISSSVITTRGMGEGSPVADNSSADGRQQNRRVEVEITSR